jgi:peptide/nickel transport system substrate-binding protein
MPPRKRTPIVLSPNPGAGLLRDGRLSRRSLLAQLPAGLLGLSAGKALAAPASAITIAWPADLISWDPTARITPLATAITESVFDTPLRLSPDLKLIPGVASWRWQDATARRLELVFRDDVTFHSGEKLTARDFRFTYLDRVAQDPTLQLASVWHPYIETIEITAPLRAVMHFRLPMPWAPYLLAEMGEAILPQTYYEKTGKDGFMARPSGSGPYRLVDYQRGSRVVLEAFDRYWSGAAKIRRVTFQVMPDATARAAAMQAGQADLTVNLPVRETLRLDGVAGLRGKVYPTTSVYLLHMVNKGAFADRNLRLAAHHAIDKQALSRAFFGGAAASLSMLSPPGTAAYTPAFRFDHDVALARQLLAKAGYSVARPAKVKLFATNGAYASDFEMARAIVQMWQKVGIAADLHILTLPEYMQLSQSGKLEGPALWSWFTATGSPVAYSYVLDPGKIFSAWKSDDVAARFAALQQETDYARLTQRYRELEIWAVEQGYTVPLLQGTTPVTHKQNLVYAPFANGANHPYAWRQS